MVAAGHGTHKSNRAVERLKPELSVQEIVGDLEKEYVKAGLCIATFPLARHNPAAKGEMSSLVELFTERAH